MTYHGPRFLHSRPQKNSDPAEEEDDSDAAYSDEDAAFMPPNPPSTLMPKLSLQPLPPERSEEYDSWLAQLAPAAKPEVAHAESLQPPRPNAKNCRKAVQQENSQQKHPNPYTIGKESSTGTECSSLHALLQQVEAQHLREIGFVRAELDKQRRVRAELEGRWEDLRQKVQEGRECKELLEELLQKCSEVTDVDNPDQPAGAIQNQEYKHYGRQDSPVTFRSKPDVLGVFPSERSQKSVDVRETEDSDDESVCTKATKPRIKVMPTGSSAVSTPQWVKGMKSSSTSYSSTSWAALHDIKQRLTQRKTTLFRQTTFHTGFGDSPLETELSQMQMPSFSERAFAVRRYVRTLVELRAFDTLCYVAIILSALQLGVTIDIAARNCDPDRPPAFFVYADYTFTTWFLLELCLRMCADGIFVFFFGPNWNWNIFDFGVVAIDVANTLYSIMQTSQESILGVARVSRVARMLRLARSLRAMRLFRFLKELRKMVLSIMRSGLPILYSMLLLCIIIFMFSTFLTQNITFYLYDHKDETNSNIEILQEYFGSLLYCGYILFQCITAGIAWGDVGKALLAVHWSNALVLSFFMFFTIFAVLNMITGIFVDGALTSAQNERDEKINNVMEKEGEVVSQLQEFFEEADADKSGFISLAKLRQQIQKPMVRARLSSLEIDLMDAKRVFTILDTDRTGEVGIEEFIFGCLRMKGTARSIDLITVMREMRKMNDSMKAAFKDVNERFKKQRKFQTDLLQMISNQTKMEQIARANAGWSSRHATLTSPLSTVASTKSVPSVIDSLEGVHQNVSSGAITGAVSM